MQPRRSVFQTAMVPMRGRGLVTRAVANPVSGFLLMRSIATTDLCASQWLIIISRLRNKLVRLEYSQVRCIPPGPRPKGNTVKTLTYLLKPSGLRCCNAFCGPGRQQFQDFLHSHPNRQAIYLDGRALLLQPERRYMDSAPP